MELKCGQNLPGTTLAVRVSLKIVSHLIVLQTIQAFNSHLRCLFNPLVTEIKLI